MMRRLGIAVVSAWAVASVLVAPGAGAAPPQGAWTEPSADRLDHDGPYVFRGVAADPDGTGIDRVEFAVVGDETEPRCRPLVDPGQPNPRAYPGNEGNGQVEFQWVVSFPCNGMYQVVARVTSQSTAFQAAETAEIVRQYAIAAPPAKVSDVTARYVPPPDDPVEGATDGTSSSTTSSSSTSSSTTSSTAPEGGTATAARASTGTVELSWSANPEPDIIEYAIARARPGESFEAWAVVPADQTSAVDGDLPNGGEYRYAVYATRGRPDRGVEPVLSEPGTARAQVPGPAAPTSTTTPDEGEEGEGDAGAPQVAGPNRPPGFDDLRRSSRPRAAPRRTVTTLDTGFADRLPFDPAPVPDEDPDDVALPRRPVGDTAVVAELTGDEADQRALLLPLAGALALLVGFLQVRFLLRRAELPSG